MYEKAGPIMKKDTQRFKEHLANLYEKQMSVIVEQYRSGGNNNLPGFQEPLPSMIFIEEKNSKNGIVISPEENGVAVTLDTNLTGILVLEGIARDFVRQVRVLLGRSRLRVEHRIVLGIHTQFLQLQNAVSANLQYIAEETLGDSVDLAWIEQPIATNHVRIYGYVAEISLTPVPSESRRRLPLSKSE